MKCNSIVGNAWEYLLNHCSLINDFDIIWVCVGNTVIEKKIIQLIKEKVIHKECIILWVEPYLIAGHALILQKEIDLLRPHNETSAFPGETREFRYTLLIIMF